MTMKRFYDLATRMMIAFTANGIEHVSNSGSADEDRYVWGSEKIN